MYFSHFVKTQPALMGQWTVKATKVCKIQTQVLAYIDVLMVCMPGHTLVTGIYKTGMYKTKSLV